MYLFILCRYATGYNNKIMMFSPNCITSSPLNLQKKMISKVAKQTYLIPTMPFFHTLSHFWSVSARQRNLCDPKFSRKRFAPISLTLIRSQTLQKI